VLRVLGASALGRRTSRRELEMTKVIRLLDRVAGRFVGELEAGACVPNNGDCCDARNYIHNCYGNCVYYVYC
jgi:hypothetical protein